MSNRYEDFTTTFTIDRAHHKKITDDGEQIVTQIYFDVSGEDTTGNTHTFNNQIVSFSPFATDTSANTFIHIDSVTDTILENWVKLDYTEEKCNHIFSNFLYNNRDHLDVDP